MTRIAIAVAALAAVVALAPSASAVYIVTPLQLTLGTDHANVGDEVEIVIGPSPDWDGASYAGRTLVVRYYYDPDEGAENRTEGGSTPSDQREIGRVTLDESSKGSIQWIVPAELDDHNAFLSVANETDSEDGLAFTHLPVGDAVPLMFALMSGEKGQAGEPEPAGPVEGAPTDTQADEADAKSNVPAPGVVAIVAGLAAAAALVARRR